MTSAHRELTKEEFIAHVAKHENAYIQRYVAALFEERAQLESQLEDLQRVGFSRDGKATLFRFARYALILAIIVIAFAWGRHLGTVR